MRILGLAVACSSKAATPPLPGGLLSPVIPASSGQGGVRAEAEKADRSLQRDPQFAAHSNILETEHLKKCC